ncbi:hypothetical protein [Tenacibaculum sp. IB213877]|uniref:hypothetical protein n=1 Tax=Tenacibaculum sp. IB213877 TaxID=3097351 RepID=UPI002A5A8158|nr:hypothetical protein [Tenacibaculum sp. IB213877]MDY0780826.1 hypothetical protein [Tenacibaculum sp. IB213877]
MLNTIINIILVLILLYTSYLLWKIGKKRKVNGLLFKMISLFILIHVVIFPIIYILIINNDPTSIEIDNKILSLEKEAKLKGLESEYNIKDIEYQEFIIEDILKSETELLIESNIYWSDNNETFDEDEPDNFIITKNSTLYFYEKYREAPKDPYGRFIVINPKNEDYKKIELKSGFNVKAIDILRKKLEELKLLKKQRFTQLNIINSNKFWSYKEVLPYTINILFTDSFKPNNRTSQIVHFLHNIIVLVFLLSLIVSLLQSYITKDVKITSVEERLDRIEKLLNKEK